MFRSRLRDCYRPHGLRPSYFSFVRFVAFITLVCSAAHNVSPLSLNPELVQYPDESVAFIIGPQVRSGADPLAVRYDEVAARRAKYWAERFLAEPLLVVSNHYDLPLCLYTQYYRTGDPEYLRLARAAAARWFAGPYINSGLPVMDGGSIPPPMYVGLMGLTLYALDGHPEVFGHLDRVAREWMDIRLLGKIGAPDIYTDMRDEGYILLAAATLARVLPDSFPQVTWGNDLVPVTRTVTDGAARRAKYLTDSENVAVNYFGRLQNADGSWRWRAWNPEPALAEKIAEVRFRGGDDRIEQPFMVGIYMEAAIALHRLTTNAAAKENLEGQIVRAADHLYRDTYVPEVTPGLTSIPRATLYFYPKEYIFDPTSSDRHLTATQIHVFGYAYQLTNDTRFVQMGDELWDSCFAVQPKDGLRSGLDEQYHLKLFTAEFRSSGRYLAWRGGVGVGAAPPPAPAVSITTPTDAATLSAGSGAVGVATATVPSVNTPSPTVLITALAKIAAQLNLKIGIANILNSKLQNAQAALDPARGGRKTTAINQLDAFINKVNAQRDKAITSADADRLISVANQIRTLLNTP